ncbi:MAG: hypothetical protein WC479_11990 [Candidatus Izemoplasmatales bacterium]
MLIQLPLTQVSDHWPFIKDRVSDSLPVIADRGSDVNSILYGLMVGTMQMWKISDTPDPDGVTRGFVLTTILGDVSDTPTFLVYMIIILDKRAKINPSADFNTLKTYATSRGCTKIGAFLENEKIISLLKDNGFKLSTYASIDV